MDDNTAHVERSAVRRLRADEALAAAAVAAVTGALLKTAAGTAQQRGAAQQKETGGGRSPWVPLPDSRRVGSGWADRSGGLPRPAGGGRWNRFSGRKWR